MAVQLGLCGTKTPKTGFLTPRLILDGTNNTYGPPDMNDNTIIKRVYCDGSEMTLQACRRETVPTCDRFAGVQCRGIVIVYPYDYIFDSCFCNCISLPLKTLGTFILSVWRVALHLICFKGNFKQNYCIITCFVFVLF